MPPRYAYWTIIVDDQPTAFRSASVEEIMPTFNRLKAKQPSAVLKWFQNGKLWDSELAAREAQIRRGEEGRRRDKNQQGDRAPRPWTANPDWKSKDTSGSERSPKLDWSPREGATRPRPEKRDRPSFKNGPNLPDAKPWGTKPWTGKPRDQGDRPPYKGSSNQRDARPRDASPRDTRDEPKLEWSPRGTATGSRPERPERRERPPFQSKPNPRDAKPWGAKPRDQRDRPPYKGSSNQRDAKPWGAKPKDTRDEPKLEWSPRGTPSGSRPERRDRPPFKSKTNSRDAKPWGAKPREQRDRPPYKGGSTQRDAKPRDAKPRDTRDDPKLEWSPRQTPSTSRPERPARQPFKDGAEPREAKRDAKWRPGGEHRDPRQKYKDAKKAKWTRFKAKIRKRTPRKP